MSQLSGNLTYDWLCMLRNMQEVLEQGFEYWAESGEIQTVTSPDLFMALTLTGLSQSTKYAFRAYATTTSGTFYGEEMTFTTATLVPPTVQTFEATEVTYTSALLRGSVTAAEEDILEQGFEYWTVEGDVQSITSPDPFMAVTLTGLEEGATYTFRAYALTENCSAYGEEMTFTTIKAPTLQTYEATEITENSALLRGTVTAGSEEVLEQGFEYWADSGEIQTIAMSEQMMAVTLTGLASNTTYIYRAYAKTDGGTTYGEEVTFTTLEDTDAVSDINANINDEVLGYYTTDGKQVPTLQKGMNIIRYSDGTAKKVMAK